MNDPPIRSSVTSAPSRGCLRLDTAGNANSSMTAGSSKRKCSGKDPVADDPVCLSCMGDREHRRSEQPSHPTVDAFVSDPNVMCRPLGLGRIQHREFAMASGEMSDTEFTKFLETIFHRLVANTVDGSIHDIFMDWRHMFEVLSAGRDVYTELKNLCVWAKTNAGMGSFYRSKHELVFVWKSGTAPHVNNFGLGQFGRSRTNIWSYPGISSMSAGRSEELAMHPTVKPCALIADATKDCSHRGALVLDAFCGSGTILIAAERIGRKARALEIDPAYVDVAVQRWQKYTGKTAVLAVSGATFEDVAEQRAAKRAAA